MVHCVSESCREELDQKWSFCPFCGTDNRPPEYRPRIRGCRHEFISAKGYCVDCGAMYVGAFEAKSANWRRNLGFAGIGSGILLLVAAFLIWRIHAQGHGIGYEWIRSWYDETYETTGRYGRVNIQSKGIDVITWMFLIGVGLIAAGCVAFAPNRSSRNSYSDWDA